MVAKILINVFWLISLSSALLSLIPVSSGWQLPFTHSGYDLEFAFVRFQLPKLASWIISEFVKVLRGDYIPIVSCKMIQTNIHHMLKKIQLNALQCLRTIKLLNLHVNKHQIRQIALTPPLRYRKGNNCFFFQRSSIQNWLGFSPLIFPEIYFFYYLGFASYGLRLSVNQILILHHFLSYPLW